MSDYLEGYRVRSRDHPSVVAWFLRGRAHEFYVNTISRNPRAYRFKDILVGLFNYCFPMNFRQKMREKLRNTRQHGRSIQSYSYEMENLFLILGMDRNEERMDAFWFGLDKYIQSELWKQMMTLKSPYEDVKAKAQVIELAREVAGGICTEHTPYRNGGSHRRREPVACANAVAATPQSRRHDRPYGQTRGHLNRRFEPRRAREPGIFVGNVNCAPAGQRQDRQQGHRNGGRERDRGRDHQA